MKYFLLIITISLVVSVNAQISKALLCFDKEIGTNVTKTYSQFGNLIDFSYYNTDSARYDYLTVKTDGTIVCKSHDIDSNFPALIDKVINARFPKEVKKGVLGNYRVGADNSGKPIYIFMLTEKDTIVFLDSKGKTIFEFEME